jgi:hypothetical protein
MDAGEIKGRLKEIRKTLQQTEKAIKGLKQHVERLRDKRSKAEGKKG